MNAFYNALYRYISPVFGYIMLFFYGIVNGFNGSYGIAIILFTLFARIIMIPTTVSQQKGMAKQQRMAPKIRRIQEKYAGDQKKIQEETQNLYSREGYNPMSAGCVPLLIQMPFIIGLFGVLYNPLRYAIGLDASTSDAFVSIFSQMVTDGTVTVAQKVDRYYPLYIIQNFNEVLQYISSKNITDISAAAIAKVQAFVDANRFSFFGLELGVTPKFKVFDKYWSIPILSGVTSLVTALITQVQQKKANPSMAKTPGAGCTMLMMPAMSLYFTFLFPTGIGIYWIASNIFATVQTLVMQKFITPQKNIAKLMIKETVERRSRENSIKRIHNN
jgi:YidC/Oxa1 family membrane protein insertase